MAWVPVLPGSASWGKAEKESNRRPVSRRWHRGRPGPSVLVLVPVFLQSLEKFTW
jgi:hypothetical protein